MNKPLKLFLSYNFAYLDRRSLFTSFLTDHCLMFEEIGLSFLSPTSTSLAFITKAQVRDRMMLADYYLVMADRYDAHASLSELELSCAFFFDVPIIVIQPWSCWSVPKPLKEKAWRIINWERKDIIAAFEKRPADSLSTLALAR
jgi:hypothetical protein